MRLGFDIGKPRTLRGRDVCGDAVFALNDRVTSVEAFRVLSGAVD